MDTEAFQKFMSDEVGYMFYDVQSLNCHVLNPNYAGLGSSTNERDLEKNISILVQTSGHVRTQERGEGPQRGFSDTITLVPNSGKAGGATRDQEGRKFLIQSQTFRFVV